MTTEPYPVTAKAKADLAEYLHIEAVATLVEALGEYEHGSADIVATGLTLEQYAVVVVDLGLYLGNA